MRFHRLKAHGVLGKYLGAGADWESYGEYRDRLGEILVTHELTN
jgi:hypothetical protein